MKLLLCLVLAGILMPSVFSQQKVLYDGYKVFRISPTSEKQVQLLQKLEGTDGVDFWEGPNKIMKSSDVMISPRQQTKIVEEVRSSGIEMIELISNVQTLIDNEQIPARVFGEDYFYWTKYYPLADIYHFLENMTTLHPGTATIINIGTSYENRELKVMKIGKPGVGKKAIWLDATIHAREWIAGAVATYFINALLTNPDYASWTEDFDFYILPVANPDGYEFSRNSNRMWRKTRQIYDGFPAAPCVGADPNRNFDYMWMQGGASDNPCHAAQTYGGPRAFSEKETFAMSEFVKTIPDLVFFGSVHAYSQLILLPFGIEGLELEPAEREKFDRIANKMEIEMGRRYGSTYTAGSITELLYPASGSSMDWAKGTLGTYLTLSFELRDTGSYGFLLPPDQIIPSSMEFLDGFQVIIDELRMEFITGGSSTPTPVAMATIILAALSFYSMSMLS